jgi:hypothetical protein
VLPESKRSGVLGFSTALFDGKETLIISVYKVVAAGFSSDGSVFGKLSAELKGLTLKKLRVLMQDEEFSGVLAPLWLLAATKQLLDGVVLDGGMLDDGSALLAVENSVRFMAQERSVKGGKAGAIATAKAEEARGEPHFPVGAVTAATQSKGGKATGKANVEEKRGIFGEDYDHVANGNNSFETGTGIHGLLRETHKKNGKHGAEVGHAKQSAKKITAQIDTLNETTYLLRSTEERLERFMLLPKPPKGRTCHCFMVDGVKIYLNIRDGKADAGMHEARFNKRWQLVQLRNVRDEVVAWLEMLKNIKK